MFRSWFRKPEPVKQPPRPELLDILAYMPHYYPKDYTIEAQRRCTELAVKEGFEACEQARHARFSFVSSDRSDLR